MSILDIRPVREYWDMKKRTKRLEIIEKWLGRLDRAKMFAYERVKNEVQTKDQMDELDIMLNDPLFASFIQHFFSKVSPPKK